MHKPSDDIPEELLLLDPDFPGWISLICELVSTGQKNDRFILVENDLPAEDMILQIRQTPPLRARLDRYDGLGGDCLTIRYQEQEIPEGDCYIQLVSSRFMLEISLDESHALRDIYLTLSNSCKLADYHLQPLSKDLPAILAYLFQGIPAPIIEIP